MVPTTELIKHDIYVQEMLDEHREILEETFGPDLRGLRERLKRLKDLNTPARSPRLDYDPYWFLRR